MLRLLPSSRLLKIAASSRMAPCIRMAAPAQKVETCSRGMAALPQEAVTRACTRLGSGRLWTPWMLQTCGWTQVWQDPLFLAARERSGRAVQCSVQCRHHS